jgi:hypothetical protein
MTESRADILGILDVSREEIFASSKNSVILIPKGEEKPCGEVYFKNEHFGVRFGDYNKSPIKKVLS